MSAFDSFLARLPLALAFFDAECRLRSGNRLWRSYVAVQTGVDRGEIGTGRSLFDLLPGTEAVLRPLVTRALAGETINRTSLRLVCEDSVFYWDMVLAPFSSADHDGFILAATDVTERVLSRTLLEKRVEDRTRKLSALYEMLAATVAPDRLDEVLEVTLEQACKATRADSGLLQVFDEDVEALHLLQKYAMEDALLDELRMQKNGASIAGWVARTQSDLTVADLATDERSSPAMRRSGLHAAGAVPIILHGRTLGVLMVLRRKRRAFTAEDMALLNSMADHLATIVERMILRRDRERLLLVKERNRLARELHDAVTQSLYSMTLFAESIRRLGAAGDGELLDSYLVRLTETSQKALQEMRLLVHNLRPSALESAGLVRALEQRLSAVERRAGIVATVSAGDDLDLPPAVEEALYFIAQEALNNSFKHAAAKRVDVEIQRRSSLLVMRIADDGSGFDPAVAEESGGLGLTTMRERAGALNGTMRIDGTNGTLIEVQINLRQAEADTPGPDLLATFERLIHE